MKFWRWKLQDIILLKSLKWTFCLKLPGKAGVTYTYFCSNQEEEAYSWFQNERRTSEQVTYCSQ